MDSTNSSDPAGFAETMAKFIRETADDLIERGACLQAADGEGVVATFGFPNASRQHAEDAVRAVLDLTKKFRERRQENEKFLATGTCTLGSVQARSLPAR